MYPGYPGLDDKDRAIIAEHTAAFDAIPGPRTGDYVEFTDGITRRISYRWDDSVQTSNGGSWHLGDGWVIFSGSLSVSVPLDTLTETDERREGSVWIFHHDWPERDNGVDTAISFRVFRCSREAPEY